MVGYQTPLTVKETLERIAKGRLVLPAIQREFVWASDPDRMARLFDSLLRGYPIGTFLFWEVPATQSRDFDFYEFMRTWHARDQRHNPRIHLTAPSDLTAVLDGQQRLTTLNIGLHGSLAMKAKYKRTTSADAYPPKYLHLDLLFEPTEDEEVAYRFAFLTRQAAAADSTAHWYHVPDIVHLADAGGSVFEYVRTHGLSEQKRPFSTLSRLWESIHRDLVVSYFAERGEELSRVLDIFVRVNSGGVVLSKSDLLLSVATAQFRTRDAREEVHRLVDDLNREGAGFNFSKDLVLKSGLVLTGISDFGFRVENFTAANMQQLEEHWDEVANALRVAVRLLASFGFSAETLPAASVLIPLADYIYQRGHTESYVESAACGPRHDRQLVRQWTIRTMLMPGVWGSGLDGLIRGFHKAIVDSTGGFPVQAIETEMARRGKALIFDDALIDDLVDTPYKHPRAFAILTLLYETVDTLSRFHIDHIFPRAMATPSRLRNAGLSESDIDQFRDKAEQLGNLQLLHGPVNLDKRATMPAQWVATRFDTTQSRDAWLAENDLLGIPDSIPGFLPFYDQRRARIRHRLVEMLTAKRVIPSAELPPTTQEDATRPPSIPSQREAFTGAARSRTLHSPPHAGASRRVYSETLADLIESGRLRVGQALHAFHRGQRYDAIVERDGLLHDGHVYESPSRAARAINGGSSDNGWERWLTEDGTPIAQLRHHRSSPS